MNSLPNNYRALIIGSSGTIGQALKKQLESDPKAGSIYEISRNTPIAIDLQDEQTIPNAAKELAQFAPLHLILIATGVLHSEELQPEKKIGDLQIHAMSTVFAINTFGPALILRYFAPLLSRDRAIMAWISAKVGSIEDNRLGGWYSYRASKAALNMIIQTGAIEIHRTNPQACLVALHPGTVKSPLSRPFGGILKGQEPQNAALQMLTSLDQVKPSSRAIFLSYDGRTIPW